MCIFSCGILKCKDGVITSYSFPAHQIYHPKKILKCNYIKKSIIRLVDRYKELFKLIQIYLYE